MSRAMEDGKVEAFSEGEEIKGGYALIRMQSPGIGETNRLLIKFKDEHVGSLPEDLEEQGRSVTADRTIRDLRRSARQRS
jgi:hypothetical protein